MAGYIGAQGQIRSGLSATIDELNIIDGVTATTAELNILDGVTATAAEINLIDGGTARGTTAVADGDGFLTNDGGTMRMTKVDTLATYIGTKVAGAGLVYIASSGAISSAANVSFTQFDATKYDHYGFWFQHVIPATDNAELYGHVSTDGGSNYDTTNGNYHTNGAADRTGLQVVGAGIGSDSNEFGFSGEFRLFAPHNSSAYTFSQAQGVYQHNDGSIRQAQAYGDTSTAHLVTQDTDAIRFAFSSGAIESGEIVMYGIANGT